MGGHCCIGELRRIGGNELPKEGCQALGNYLEPLCIGVQPIWQISLPTARHRSQQSAFKQSGNDMHLKNLK